MATETIRIVIMEQGSKQAADNIGKIGDSAKDSNDALIMLRRALQTVAAVASVQKIIELADSYVELRNRISLVTKDQDAATAVMQKIADVASDTRGNFVALGELYARIALSTRGLTYSQQQLLDVTSTLSKASTLSGATFRESSLALIQLSQGLASGTLRGDELRSVLEQLPAVADIISKHMGVTRGALRFLAAQGKVTADVVVAAVLEQKAAIDKAFAGTAPTISQAIDQIQNAFTKWLGELNDSTGIFTKVANAIVYVSKNIDVLARLIGVALVTALALAIQYVFAFTAALLANPLTATVAAITAAVAALVLFSDQIKVSADGVVTLQDYAKAAWPEIKNGVTELWADLRSAFSSGLQFIAAAWNKMFQSIGQTPVGLLTVILQVVDKVIGLFAGLSAATGAIFANLGGTVEAAFKGIINTIIDRFERLINDIIGAINDLRDSVGGDTLGIPQLKELKLNRVELTANAKQAATDVASAFKDGLENTHVTEDFVKETLPQFATDVKAFFKDDLGFGDFLKRLDDNARAIAEKRVKDQTDAAARIKKAQDALSNPNSPESGLKTTQQVAIDLTIEQLNRETEALRGTTLQREHEIALLKIREDLIRKGVTLSRDDAEASFGAAIKALQSAKVRAQVEDEVVGTLEKNAEKQKAVNDLIAQGGDNVDLYTRKLRELKIEQLSSQQSLEAGFKKGFLQVQQDISDFATQSSKVVTDAFSGMEDAIVSFVQTGKLSFADLANSILADLTRIIFRMAVAGLLNAIVPGGGLIGGILGGASSTGAGHAAGGPVTKGTSYMVGERGPEMFTPSQSGSITPNGAMGGGASPVNVTVVNVSDPNQVNEALNDPKTQDVMVNVLRRNRTAVKQALGISG